MSRLGVGIFGSSGAGKTTLTNSISEFFNEINRPFKIINLDPASKIYADFNISEVINVYDCENLLKLGPNGSIDFCFEFLLVNIKVLEDFINDNPNTFLIFDLPGQVETLICHDDCRKLFELLHLDIIALFLSDSTQLETFKQFVSIELQVIAAEAVLSLPFLALFTKIDLHDFEVEKYLEEDTSDELVEFSIRNYQDSFKINCKDCNDIKNLINEVDVRLGYLRGGLGEYKSMSKEEAEEIENFMSM